MNRFKKVLSLLTAIALLLSGALALAEETIEAPVVDSEPVQVEEIAQETAAAQEELPIIEEEIPAQEEATQEEAPAADETPAQEENTVVEETPVQEEAPAAEPESDPVPSYNNNEETPAEETPAQEEAPVAGEDPFDGDDADDDESYSEDELVTFDDDNWGYVDPEIVSDYIPEMTAELKFPEITKLSVNEKVAGNIDAENDAQYVIKAESSKTIVLDLVASSEKVNVKINDKAVKFVKDEEAASYHATYTMNITAGQEYIITLTSSSKVAYKLSVETAQAVEEKAEEVTEEEVVEDTEEETTEEPAEETEEETVETTEEVEEEATEEEPAEETEEETVETTDEVAEEATEEEPAEETEEETVETTEEVEEEATEEEPAEETEEETVETSEEVEEETTEEEPAEETEEEIVEEPVEEKIEENASEEEGIEDSSDEYNTVVETTEEEAVPAMVGWVVADADAYVIGETATLTANSKSELNNRVTWQTKVQDGEWKTTGFGNILKVDLTEENANNFYRFKMEDGNFSDGIQLIVAPALVEEIAEEVTEEETVEEEQTEVKEEAAEEQVEAEEEVAEEQAETEEAVEEEQSEGEEEVAEERNEVEEETEEEIEETEEEVVEEEPLTDEDMLAMGYIKVFVGMDIGADVFESVSGNDPIGHLEAATDLWIKLINGSDRAMIYNEDESASTSYIRLVDLIATLKPEDMEDLPTRRIELTSNLEGLEKVFYGMREDLTVKMEGFEENDQYSITWMTSFDNGETFETVTEANGTEFSYRINENNVHNIWKVIVLLTPNEE